MAVDHLVACVPGAHAHQPFEVIPRILLVAPEGGRSPLVEELRRDGFAVVVVPDARVVEVVERGGVDLVLLHGGPRSAWQQLLDVRAASELPVLVSLRDGRSAVDTFLAAGADDCVRPRAPRSELAIRARALLRRHAGQQQQVLRAGTFVMDLGRHAFRKGEVPVHLAPKEFALLELLIRRDGRVVSRQEALDAVWGTGRVGDPGTVDVHVKRLRAKIEPEPAEPQHLLTVRRLGYRFSA